VISVKKLSAKQAERIEAAVAAVLSRDFEHIRIIDVNVSPDSDRDGNDLLRIEVVFEGKLKGRDVKHAAGAVRRLRPTLEKFDGLFPLVSFVSKLDYERGNAKVAAR
jgi:hypothetical protein